MIIFNQMLPKKLGVSSKCLSFNETIAFHQHNAICNDLNELFNLPVLGGPSSPVVGRSSSSSPSMLHGGSSMESQVTLTCRDYKVCQVQFKHGNRTYKFSPQYLDIQIGDFVIVQSYVDKRCEDMGIATAMYSPDQFDAVSALLGPSEDPDENKVGKIIRLATLEERKYLPQKLEREFILYTACKEYVEKFYLDMKIYGVDFQYDGNVLFVYYYSKDRVDFRPLVKFLLKTFCKGTRIQMKKTTQCRPFVPVQWAANALKSGNCFTPQGL